MLVSSVSCTAFRLKGQIVRSKQICIDNYDAAEISGKPVIDHR